MPTISALTQLKFGACTSEIHLETPYTQVAIHTAKQTNYSAQHAVQDFLNKPTVFRIRLDLCYQENAPPNGIKLKSCKTEKPFRGPPNPALPTSRPPTNPPGSAFLENASTSNFLPPKSPPPTSPLKSNSPTPDTFKKPSPSTL
jgi:hypothetical protein